MEGAITLVRRRKQRERGGERRQIERWRGKKGKIKVVKGETDRQRDTSGKKGKENESERRERTRLGG